MVVSHLGRCGTRSISKRAPPMRTEAALPRFDAVQGVPPQGPGTGDEGAMSALRQGWPTARGDRVVRILLPPKPGAEAAA